MSTAHQLDPDTERAARRFMAQIACQFDVAGAYVFGSRARGDARADSDTDIAVLLHGTPGKRMSEAMKMADIAFDVMLETGILVEALPLWQSEWENPESFNNPSLIANIRREGISL